MIFIDSNIPMYLVGANHPNKVEARNLVENAVSAGERLVTSCEVFQEILHRYVAIDRRDAIQPAFEALLGVVDEVLPIERRHMQRARDLVLGSRRISARDALHVAVMEGAGISRIISFDTGFDGIPGITRVAG
jgi:predicted nucleic acid-binding protein